MYKVLDLGYVGGLLTIPNNSGTSVGWKQWSAFRVDRTNDASVSSLVYSTGLSNAPAEYTDSSFTGSVIGTSAGNHWLSKVTSATGGSGDNGGTGAVTPKGAVTSILGLVAGTIKTVRIFISLDQLFKTTVVCNSGLASVQAVGTILDAEAVANFADFCAIADSYGMHVIPVIYENGGTGNHSLYTAGLLNCSNTGSQTANQAAVFGTYLNALQEFLTAILKYPHCTRTIACIDLHNEGYYQCTNASLGNLSVADTTTWLRSLCERAKSTAPTFLYTISEISETSDVATNLCAGTPAHQQAAIRMYSEFGVDVADRHFYFNAPGASSTVTAILKACRNLPWPWYAGEAGDAGAGTGSIYFGDAWVCAQATDYYYRYAHNYGCSAVCLPSISNWMDFSSVSGDGLVYTDSAGMGVLRKVATARR